MLEAYAAYEICEWGSSPLAEPRYSNPKRKKFADNSTNMQPLNQTHKREINLVNKTANKEVSGRSHKIWELN